MAPVERVAEHARGRDPFTGAQIRIGVMGSASAPVDPSIAARCRRLGHAVAEHGCCPLHCGDFRLARTPAESRAINEVSRPVLIVSASGMVTGGRVLHHLRQRLPDPRTTVLLVGYQAVGSRGRRLQEGANTVKSFGDEVPVRARVESIHGLSAHADADGLLRWLGTAARPPARVFVVHGDPGPAATLAGRIRTELGWRATVPAYRDRAPLGGGDAP